MTCNRISPTLIIDRCRTLCHQTNRKPARARPPPNGLPSLTTTHSLYLSFPLPVLPAYTRHNARLIRHPSRPPGACCRRGAADPYPRQGQGLLQQGVCCRVLYYLGLNAIGASRGSSQRGSGQGGRGDPAPVDSGELERRLDSRPDRQPAHHPGLACLHHRWQQHMLRPLRKRHQGLECTYTTICCF